jgi:hypothetical protein
VPRPHRLDRGFLSCTREEHEAEVLGCGTTVLEEDDEGMKSDKDELEKANIGAQRLVKKLEEEKAWQNKYLSLLEGNKRPREEDLETTKARRRSEINSSKISMDNSSTTVTISSSATLSSISSNTLSNNSSDTPSLNLSESISTPNYPSSASRSAGANITDQVPSNSPSSAPSSLKEDEQLNLRSRASILHHQIG